MNLSETSVEGGFETEGRDQSPDKRPIGGAVGVYGKGDDDRDLEEGEGEEKNDDKKKKKRKSKGKGKGQGQGSSGKRALFGWMKLGKKDGRGRGSADDELGE